MRRLYLKQVARRGPGPRQRGGAMAAAHVAPRRQGRGQDTNGPGPRRRGGAMVAAHVAPRRQGHGQDTNQFKPTFLIPRTWLI